MDEVGLEEILSARDALWSDIRQHLSAGGYALVVSVTMNIPGPVKNSPLIARSFDLAIQDVFCKIGGGMLLPLEKASPLTGPYALFACSPEISPETGKRFFVTFEEEHPIGRWLDFDLWGKDGTQVGREALGFGPRKCLLCGEDAKICGRSRKHATKELYDYTVRHLDAYVRASG